MRTRLLAAVLLLGACDPAPAPGIPCTIWESGDNVRLQEVRDVDLLFVSDDSNSAADWALMMEQLPRMLRMLSSGDLDGDGTRDFEPVRSIHVGAISTDLGAQGVAVPTCEGDGDDGLLASAGRTSVTGCMPSYPRVHTLEESGDSDVVAADVACLAGLDHDGCGYEQPLEATLRALSPSMPTEWTAPDYVPPSFAGDRRGHALDANEGFLRPDSLLAIVVIEDEDDCSVANPSFFDPDDATLGEPNLRCGTHAELLHEIERYTRGIPGGSTGLLGLRVDPSNLVFAAITGVPPELIPESGTVDYAAILSSAAMELRVDPAAPSRFVPSCQATATGIAFPPRRLVETARALDAAGASTTVQSICNETFGPAIDAITRAIADGLRGSCLPRSLSVEPEHYESCTMTEVMPPGVSCDGQPGLTAFRQVTVDGALRDECIVRQLSRSETLAGEPGWFFEQAEDPLPDSAIVDSCGPDGARLRLIGRESARGATSRISCPRSIGPDGGICHAR